MLEAIGIYGMEKIETAVLAGLVTGDPVLLVGSHGSGKTLLCQRLAKALDLSFWAYDAGKALFEDVLGFPNPASLSTGSVDYVPTPVSIWGKEFVLIDELSRANPSMQNKWLEIIRSRRIMGKDLPDLKFIIAAMNPPSYLGAHPLDAALAGRFAFVVQVPEVTEMSKDSVNAIVRQLSEEDAPMLKATRPAPQGFRLDGFLSACRRRMAGFNEVMFSRLSDYVRAFNNFLDSRELGLDGRRLGMIWRSLQAYLAVEMEMHCMSGDKSVAVTGEERDGNVAAPNFLSAHSDAIYACVSASVPFIATGEKAGEAAIRGAHYHALPALSGAKSPTVFVAPSDPLAAVADFVRLCPDLGRDERRSAITRILSAARTKDTEKKPAAQIAVFDLAHALTTGDLPLDPDDQYRVLSAARQVLVPDADETSEIFETLRKVMDDCLRLDPREGNALLCYRASYLTGETDPRPWRRNRINHDDIFKTATAMLEIIRRRGGKP